MTATPSGNPPYRIIGGFVYLSGPARQVGAGSQDVGAPQAAARPVGQASGASAPVLSEYAATPDR